MAVSYDPVVRPYLTIFTLAAIALLGFWLVRDHLEKKAIVCDTVTLTGWINPKTFLAVKDCLIQSTARNKTFLVKYSGGGSWESALALGILIHRHGWNVEVVDLCASSCANFIFPAGKTKYLHGDSMLLFHGGPHQKNLLAQMIAMEIDQTLMVDGAPIKTTDPDTRRTEGYPIFDAEGAADRLKVREFLSVKDVTDVVDLVAKMRSVSDQFYEELGINLLLPGYGQLGRYEPTYMSGKYGGFIYRLDSLRRLGVTNIELKDGEWHPERHRDYPDVYEVTYP